MLRARLDASTDRFVCVWCLSFLVVSPGSGVDVRSLQRKSVRRNRPALTVPPTLSSAQQTCGSAMQTDNEHKGLDNAGYTDTVGVGIAGASRNTTTPQGANVKCRRGANDGSD